MAKPIVPFRLQTTFEIDPKQGRAAFKLIEGDLDHVTTKFEKAGKAATAAFKGADAGRSFGRQFSAGATAVITSDFKQLGTTLGGLIGTAIAPGIGTAIGSTIGGVVDSTLGKVSGSLMESIERGIDLNKELERTTVEFKTFAGSEKEAKKYLAELKDLAVDSGTDFRFLLDASEHTFDLTNNLKLTRTILRAATDQAADFGGKAETIGKVAEQLGLIAEKGELASRELQKLYKLGIDAKKYLSEATGVSQKQIERMIAAGRVRGDVAARLIAEGIEREKGGFAARIARTTNYGAEARANVQQQLLEQKGTVNITQAQGDLYRLKGQILGSSQANDVVTFIDKTAGQVLKLVESGLKSGYELTRGIAEGIMSGNAQAMLKSSFGALGGFVTTELKSVFGIESPSKLTRDEIGIPLGQGVSLGMLMYGQDHAEEDIKRFIALYTAAARKAMQETGVPASVSMAQAIIESGVGKSGLTRRAKNFFGIKGTGPAGSVTMRTREETRSGQSYYVNAPFRVYNSPEESFTDHARLLLNPRYRGALRNAGDPKQYAQDIARAGYASDKRYAQKIGSTIDRYGLGNLDTMVGGNAVSSTNPMPVVVVASSGRAVLESAGGYSKSTLDWMYGSGATSKPGRANAPTVNLGMADAAVVNINSHAEQLVATTNEFLKTSDLMLRPMQQLEYDAGLAAEEVDNIMAARKAEYAATEQYMEAAKQALFTSVSITQQLSGMISQASGFLPQEQVGKKRGLFSKILGFAAPFLSFIPGVGPILSQIAGMASQGLAGNWAGVAQGVAGFHHGSGGGGSTSAAAAAGYGASTTKTGVHIAPGITFGGHRAFGGPVRRGRTYMVGEMRPELFTPNNDGWIHPNTGGGGEMMDRLVSALERLEAVSPGHVLAQGARENPRAIGHGLTRAYDQDAGILRDHGRRHRFA